MHQNFLLKISSYRNYDIIIRKKNVKCVGIPTLFIINLLLYSNYTNGHIMLEISGAHELRTKTGRQTFLNEFRPGRNSSYLLS